jgi:hypothetical protein
MTNVVVGSVSKIMSGSEITNRIILLSNLKCSLNLPEIEQRPSDLSPTKAHSKFDPRVLGPLHTMLSRMTESVGSNENLNDFGTTIT